MMKRFSYWSAICVIPTGDNSANDLEEHQIIRKWKLLIGKMKETEVKGKMTTRVKEWPHQQQNGPQWQINQTIYEVRRSLHRRQLHSNIEFTLEIESKGKLLFLLLSRKQKLLKLEIFRKSTDAKRVIHSNSHHAHQHKVAFSKRPI